MLLDILMYKLSCFIIWLCKAVVQKLVSTPQELAGKKEPELKPLLGLESRHPRRLLTDPNQSQAYTHTWHEVAQGRESCRPVHYGNTRKTKRPALGEFGVLV